MKQIIVAPSLLAADFRFLDRELKLLKTHNITYLHFDVMDGHFVPNLSFGLTLLDAISPHYDFVYDVHLMISNPEIYADEYIKKGADIVTFHYEVMENEQATHQLIKKIKSLGAKAGMSIKPGTDVEVLFPYLNELDLVLIMSVEPGFGGQSFMENSLEKISALARLKKMHNFRYLIEVDGGINSETGALVKKAGAEVLVAGSYLFNQQDMKQRIKKLRDE
ncbi:MAG TPA: ribulose-phosphate 3-epimerase [Bacilli bacterium]|nr:ribulose-phosphate 3-epimerase [Bacilli bacterium]